MVLGLFLPFFLLPGDPGCDKDPDPHPCCDQQLAAAVGLSLGLFGAILGYFCLVALPGNPGCDKDLDPHPCCDQQLPAAVAVVGLSPADVISRI